MGRVEMNKAVVVDGWRYLISHPNPEVAWEIGIDLMKLIGEPLAAVATVGDDAEKMGMFLPAIVKALTAKLDAKQTLAMVKRILATVEVQGPENEADQKLLLNDAGFKLHFHGRPGSVMKLVGEVIGFTHKSFFSAIGDGIAEMMKQAQDKAGGEAPAA